MIKTKNCRLCGASFVPDNNTEDEQYCNICYDIHKKCLRKQYKALQSKKNENE